MTKGKVENLMPSDSADGGCAASEPFALRVLGDSMEPEFKDGCIIIVDPSATAGEGAFVVAEIDSGPILRQLVIRDSKRFLKPLNPGYDTEPLPGRSKILGIVVQRAGTRRKDHKHYI